MSKAVHFARLERAARTTLPRCAMRIALLTGQSRLEASALSNEQRAFLHAVALPGMSVTDVGFPFDADERSLHHAPALWRASLANARQFFWAATSEGYRTRAASALQRLVDATEQALVFVTGSCGLVIFSGVQSRLRLPTGLRVGVLAFGPAGHAPGADVQFKAIRGRGDYWSRALYSGPPATLIDAGHMAYWTSAEARAAAQAFTREYARR